MRRTIDIEERRARVARRHHLAAGSRSDDVLEIVRDVVALHSTDPASVFLSVMARSDALDVADIERALYAERSVLRMLGMRRTMWVVPVEMAAVVHGACTRAIEVRERKRLVQFLAESGVTDEGETWLADVEEATMQALAGRGEASATEVARDVAGLQERLHLGVGTKWEVVQGASGRVLFVMGAAGRIVRGRPRGSWISSQYRWAPAATWLPDSLHRGVTLLPEAVAQVQLVWKWLASFGPGTVADLAWWTGLTMGQVRKALSELPTVEVDLGGPGGTGLVLADDAEPVDPPPPAPSVTLLPALDPTVMGWKGRSWYLGDHGPALFDRSGNAGPTVWWDGRIVGGWAQRKAGEVVVRLLEDVGGEVKPLVEAEAARLEAKIGSVRITPRFRTPLERELSA
ncbi:MAG TPA: winged helix DNA-binding domain-containing protein [Acidimicrobiales bacterium]|nr:winged helix DNA-binding domain-containing protein [Acidimicrobiales bacterium]